ncbi:MAG: hypothetical protein AAFU85_25100 [Planctomycetota bacterium]
MSRIDREVFTVTSVDVDAVFQASTYEFIAELSNGGSIVQTFAADFLRGNQTVFLIGFEDIKNLRFGIEDSLNLANVGSVDNIQIASSSVPEPASFAFWSLVGLVGMGTRRRRH